MIEFLKRNWLGLFGLLLGIFGILLSIYFYLQSIAVREPVFFVDPARTDIVRADRLAVAPLKVVRADGSAIVGDVSSVRLFFWNRGKLPIKRENVLRPLIISLLDSQSEILDFRILKISRDVVNAHLERASTTPQNSLSLNFQILEQDDGVCFQIIYVGNPIAEFALDGQIEGVPNRIGASKAATSRFWSIYFSKVKTFVLFVGIMIVFAVAQVLLSRLKDFLKEKLTDPRYTRSKQVFEHVESFFFGGIAIAFVVWLLIYSPYKSAKKEAVDSIVKAVPLSIVPQLDGKESPNK